MTLTRFHVLLLMTIFLGIPCAVAQAQDGYGQPCGQPQCGPYYRRCWPRIAPYAEVSPALPIRFVQEQGVVVRRPETALRAAIKQELAEESGEASLETRLNRLEDDLSELSSTLNELTKIVQTLADQQAANQKK